MQKRFVIFKVPTYGNPNFSESYYGDIWDKAGIRHLYQESYSSEKEAQELAQILSQYNLHGFKIGIQRGN